MGTDDFAVLASRREGLPKSLLEAAACGRAMVATDAPGCREIAIDGVTALTVPVDDAAALADAMQKLAGDKALREIRHCRARAGRNQVLGRGHRQGDSGALRRAQVKLAPASPRIMATMPSWVAIEGRQPISISLLGLITKFPEIRSQSASLPNDFISRFTPPCGTPTR